MKEKITTFIIDELLNGQKVEEQDDLLLSGIIDSLGVMRLVTFIEENTQKTVPAEDVTIENFANLEKIGCYLEKLTRS